MSKAVRNGWRPALIGILALMVASCSTMGPLPQLASSMGLKMFGTNQASSAVTGALANGQAARPVPVPAIVGRAIWPTPGRRVQTTMTDIASASTVSLIDTSTDTTVATTVTDGSGNFSLSFSGWSPVAGRVYNLEAIKGLANNLPGNNAARVRTLIAFNSGAWSSITVGGIDITDGTTALSVGAALRNAQAGPFNFNSLLGTVFGTTYSPVTGLSSSDYTSLLNLVDSAITNNWDPVATIGLTLPDTWVQVNTPGSGGLSVTSLSPATGTIGTAVTFTGSGFSTTAASDSATFHGASAVSPPSSTNTSFTVTVPSGSLTGSTMVQAGNTLAWGPTFSVVPTVTSLSPGSATTGTSIVVSGTGFDPTAANDTVTFGGGATGTLTAATSTQLTVTVPASALTGPVTVTTAGGSATSASSLTVLPAISTLSPTSGPTGTSVTITGTGF
ncbi:MAG: IPT/TIG domain-containing protein, partial [Cyanobacteria bacterium REEB65]|nr:IPT/TIG domain-containing protein [Cyanobacteria bacterium REEB65]